jgi:predicted enzyme related to lactoylglutathione lyase
MGNPFVHVELMSNDVGKAKTFYGKLFDWKLEDMPMGDMTYTMIKVGEGTGGGMMKNPIPGAPSAWMAYVLVDDVKAATAKAKSLGAAVMKDATEVMGAGTFSIITDPTGAMLGLWQVKKA